MKKDLLSAEAKLVELQEKWKIKGKLQEEEIKGLKNANTNLKQKVQVMQQQLKAREKDYEVLKQKLDSLVIREEKKLVQEKKIFQELLKRPPRPTGSHRAAIHDSKVLEIISMFETQRTEMEKELRFLRKEVKNLNALLLLEKENKQPVENNQEAARGSPQVNANVDKLLTVEELKRIEKELKDAKAVNDNLLLELESRPTLAQWKEAQKKIADLEKKLLKKEAALYDKKQQEIEDGINHLSDRLCR